MGVKQYKPTSPGRRFMMVSDFAEITRSKPEKSLVAPLKKHAGRNNKGRITTRHQGGGHKRRYRITISSATRTAYPPRLPRSSTILTVPRASRCCTTSTARSATSCIRRACM